MMRITKNKNLNFKKKVILSFSIILSGILTTLLFIFITYISLVSRKNLINNNLLIVKKIQEQLDSSISQLDQLSLGLLYNQTFMELMQSSPQSSTDYISTHDFIIDTCISILGGDFTFDRIIITNQNDCYTLSTSPENVKHIQEAKKSIPWLINLHFSKGKPLFIPPHQDIWSTEKNIVFSLARNIIDYTGTIYGYIEITQNSDELERICSIDPIIGQILLFDKSGKLIHPYLPSSDNFYNSYLEVISADSLVGHYSNRTQDIFYDKSSTYGIYCLLISPSNFYSFLSDPQIYILVILFISIFVIAFIIIKHLITTLTHPLITLTTQVQNITLNNLNLPTPQITYVDEIDQLHHSFQDMLSCLSASLEESVIAKNNEMLSYYHSLEAQINPHMICNVISIIESLCYTSGNKKAATLCINLCDLIRYTSDFSNTTYTLKDELTHLKNYANLMCARYEDCLCIDISIDPTLFDFIIPKLTLQTIVENAIKHGFKNREHAFQITVKVYPIVNGVEIQIIDNGTGISDEKIQQLYNSFKTITSLQQNITHLGLLSLYSRLKLLFKDSFNFSIANATLHGCIVTITIFTGGSYD